MSAIGTTTSYANNISALLLANSSNESSTADSSSNPTTQAPPTSDPGSGDRGPATNVQLSDKVKAILAQASSDAAVAARLASFVQAHRTAGTGTAGASSSSDSPQSTTQAANVDQSFDQLTDSSAQPDTQDSGPVQAKHDFSNGVVFQGYTLGVLASAETGSHRIELMGPNGVSFYDLQFGSSDDASGGSTGQPGTSISESQQGNVEYITVNQSEAATTSTTVSTGTQAASSSAAVAQTSQITFAIDFSTGSIQATETNALTAASTQSATQTPSFSTVA